MSFARVASTSRWLPLAVPARVQNPSSFIFNSQNLSVFPSVERSQNKSLSLSKPRHICFAAANSETASSPPSTEEKKPSESDDVDTAKLIGGVEIRIGKVLKAWKHPEADSLYVEEVDLGEATGPRTICSGLVKFVELEELQNRLVVVLANLKPRNMRGVKSNGMLLAASDASHEHVELLNPPEGAEVGERVWFGDEGTGADLESPLTPNQLQKKKVWEAVQPLLKTDGEGSANFEGRTMRVKSGVVRSKTLRGANIS